MSRMGFAAVNAAIEPAKAKRDTSRTPTKVYELYPYGASFSVKTVDYHGTSYHVAATLVRQAYAVAHKGVWINPADEHPVGIVCIYCREAGTTLWCGCCGHHVKGGQPDRGAGIRDLRAAIDAHYCGGQQAANR